MKESKRINNRASRPHESNQVPYFKPDQVLPCTYTCKRSPHIFNEKQCVFSSFCVTTFYWYKFCRFQLIRMSPLSIDVQWKPTTSPRGTIQKKRFRQRKAFFFFVCLQNVFDFTQRHVDLFTQFPSKPLDTSENVLIGIFFSKNKNIRCDVAIAKLLNTVCRLKGSNWLRKKNKIAPVIAFSTHRAVRRRLPY